MPGGSDEMRTLIYLMPYVMLALATQHYDLPVGAFGWLLFILLFASVERFVAGFNRGATTIHNAHIAVLRKFKEQVKKERGAATCASTHQWIDDLIKERAAK